MSLLESTIREHKFSTGDHNQRAQIFDRGVILKRDVKYHNQRAQIFDRKPQSESTNFRPGTTIRERKFSTAE